ncbi:MAG: formate hydrogenlyase [Gammaproteobacteria bacterium]|nr:MAG: formate hydrogenlyase [Gammaproteobacteria bacterium]
MNTGLLVLFQFLFFALAAPLLAGWVKRVKARLQNRRGTPLLQGYRELWKLMGKQALVPDTASPVYRIAPYVVFASTLLAAATLPVLGPRLPLASMADIIVLVGLLALGRFFLALAGMDVGTAFGGLGSSREMLISSLAEPAILMAVFTLTLTAHSTNLASVTDFLLHSAPALRPSFLFALMALLLVGIAETGRIPVDNPATHLELTMVHEAMILEYSGRHLALMEWAAQIKLLLYAVLLVNLFFPWGMDAQGTPTGTLVALTAVTFKLAVVGTALGVTESVLAKMRLFKVPLYLDMAFLLALLGLLSHVILEVGSR